MALIIIVLVLIILFSIGVAYGIKNKRRFEQYLKFDPKRINTPKNIDKLREILTVELAKKDSEFDFKFLNKPIKILNTTGICYFNVIIQALAANLALLEVIIMTDFDEKAIILRILQSIFYKLFMTPLANIYEEHGFLRDIAPDGCYFGREKGSSVSVLNFFNEFLEYEIERYGYNRFKKELLNKMSIDLYYKCDKCNKKIQQKIELTFLPHFRNGYSKELNLDDFIDPYIKVRKHYCGFLKIEKYELELNIQMPKTLIFINPIFKLSFSDRFEIYLGLPIESITVLDVEYTLFAIIIHYFVFDTPHAALLIKKCNKFYFSSDTNYQQLNHILADSKVSRYSKILLYAKV